MQIDLKQKISKIAKPSTYKRVIVVGSVGFDSIMRLPGRFSDYIMPDSIDQLNVSFTVETFRKEFGGTGGNCAFTLGMLDVEAVLVSAWGTDRDAYQEHLKAVGVNLKHMVDAEGFSATGNVITDVDHNQMWMFYPGALKRCSEVHLQEIVRKHDFVILMPSQPAAFGKHLRELVEFEVDFMFDPAFFVPNLSVKELALGIKHASIIIGNEYELGLIERKTGTELDEWLQGGKIVIRTAGKHGSYIFQGDKVWEIPVVKPMVVADPTGAGDAYRSGFIAGYITGKDLVTCGRMGALTSTYCVEKEGTQTHGFELEQFLDRYEKNFGERLLL